VVDPVAAELKLLRQLIEKSPKLERLLESPVVSFGEKRKVIEGTFGHFSKVTQSFLLVLIERRRAPILSGVVDSYIQVVNHKAGVAAVEVQTARPLEQDERESIKALLSKKLNKTVNLNESVHPDLLGGMVLIHEDTMWDRSVKNALKTMIGKMEGLKLATIKWAD